MKIEDWKILNDIRTAEIATIADKPVLLFERVNLNEVNLAIGVITEDKEDKGSYYINVPTEQQYELDEKFTHYILIECPT